MRIRTSTNTIMPALHKSAPPDKPSEDCQSRSWFFLLSFLFCPRSLGLEPCLAKVPAQGAPTWLKTPHKVYLQGRNTPAQGGHMAGGNTRG